MNSINSIQKSKSYFLDGNVKNYLDADYIYIPIKNKENLQMNNHATVYKEELLVKNEDNIYSPISGTIIGATKVKNYNNEDINAIVIENDFKEKIKKRKGTKKNINIYSKEDVIKLIKEFNITSRPIIGKTMIINGIDLDPFEENNSFIIKTYTEKILECIDALCEIFKIKKCFFAIKNNDSENVNILINNLGSYPNINLRLMPDTYPLGKQEILVKKLLSEKQIKQGVIYFNVEEILEIYEALKRNKPLSEKIITLSGDLIEKPTMLNVKIGTLVKDIIENNAQLINQDYLLIVNGLFIGHEINENTVFTKDIRSIFLMKKIETKEKECINCGLCVNVCPVNINPKYMHANNNKKSQKYKIECINCGLCSYVCPSKINLLKE